MPVPESVLAAHVLRILMSNAPTGGREGSLEAPTRHPIDWRNPDFYNEAALTKELDRVFDICHGCRRCFSLCQSFPTLFDAIDATASGELEGVDRKVYWEVTDHCYLCDMCFMTKCPAIPRSQPSLSAAASSVSCVPSRIVANCSAGARRA